MSHGGFLQDADRFDARFFNIGPAEAAVMDPQQRLLLEHGYQALHGAGHTKASLSRGSAPGYQAAVGVFVGVWASEFAAVLRESAAGRSVYAAAASACSVVAGRVSFTLGLQGPCMSVDTACSSGLVASPSP